MAQRPEGVDKVDRWYERWEKLDAGDADDADPAARPPTDPDPGRERWERLTAFRALAGEAARGHSRTGDPRADEIAARMSRDDDGTAAPMTFEEFRCSELHERFRREGWLEEEAEDEGQVDDGGAAEGGGAGAAQEEEEGEMVGPKAAEGSSSPPALGASDAVRLALANRAKRLAGRKGVPA